MEVDEISVLNNKPSKVSGHPLTVKQKIWCYYIIPGIGFLICFVINFSLDLSVGLELLNEQQRLYGCLTFLFLYLPAFICYLQELVKTLPPTERSKNVWKLCKETAKLIIFPTRILKCLGKQLFWIVELMKGTTDQEEALKGFEECFDKAAGNYLFFQIFLQNIPQGLLQFHMITAGISSYNDTDVIQAFCAIVSLATAAHGIMQLHRYESQCITREKAIRPQSFTSDSTQRTTDSPATIDPLIPQRASSELQLPTRNPWIKGLEEDNPIGKLLLFLFWFTFLSGRTLTIITAIQFSPKIVITVIIIHIFIMFLYYVWYPCKIHKKIFLSITSVFFIIEVGIKFKKISYLYFLFIVTTLTENVGLTLLWIWKERHAHSWWNNYILFVDINVHVLAFIFFTIYLLLFKPKEKRFEWKNTTLNQQ